MPDNSTLDPIAPLAEEFVARFRAGERPALTEFIARHPEHEGRIRQLFPLLAMMEQAASTSQTTDATIKLTAPALDQVGGYRILREIGRGGMGIVYEAEQLSLGRRIALKVLPLTAARDASGLERFRREARAAAHLHHSHIVPVYEVGEEGDLCYYAMQLVRGQPLDVVLEELRRLRQSGETSALSGELHLPEEAAPSSVQTNRHLYHRSVARIGLQVARALEYAHREGVIHRDVKPSNLLLDGQGQVWLTDFGLAHTDGAALTRTGDIVGTLRYMAPERFAGWSDARSDVYSLGLTLYELLTLKPAFDFADQAALLRAILNEEPPPLRRSDPSMPRDLETIVGHAIDREPGQRYASAGALADDLERFLEDRPIAARRQGRGERAWRWCKRNRAVACLAAALLVALTAGLAGVAWKWGEAEDSARKLREHANDLEDGARRLNEAEAHVARAERHLNPPQGGLPRWREAEKELIEAGKFRDDYARVWDARARINLQLGMWELAEADLDRSHRLRPLNDSIDCFSLALLRLYRGDPAGFLLVRDEMRQRFGTADKRGRFLLVRVCNLSADAGIDRAWILDLSKKPDGPAAALPWLGLYYRGSAEMRAGRHAEAVETLKQSLAAATFEQRAMNYPVLAMAHHHLGQDREARLALTQTREEYERSMNRMMTNRALFAGLQPRFWYDWIEYQVLYREAYRLIEGESLPADPRMHVPRGRALLLLGRDAEAGAEFDRAVARRPDQVLHRQERLRFYLVQKRFDEAHAEAGRIDELRPTDPEVYLDICRLYADRQDYARASAAHKNAVALRPNDLNVRLAYCRHLYTIGHIAEGDAALQEAVKGKKDAAFHAACAEAVIGMRQWRQAKERYAAAIAAGSTNGDVWFRHGLLCVYFNDLQELRQTRRLLLQRHDHEAQTGAAHHLGMVSLLDPDADAATTVKVAQRWVKANPTAGRDHPLLGMAQLRAGRDEEALAILEQAHRKYTWIDIKIALALVHHRLGNVEKTIEFTRQIPVPYRRIDPAATNNNPWYQHLQKQFAFRELDALTQAEAWEGIDTLMRQRRWSEALAKMNVLEATAKQKWGYWYLRAACQVEKGDLKVGLADLDRFAVLRPRLAGSIHHHWAHVVLRLTLGDDKGYRADCARHLADLKDTANVNQVFGLAVHCGIAPDAVADYRPLIQVVQRAVDAPDTQIEFRHILGIIYLRAGRVNEAIEQLTAATAGREDARMWEPVDWLWLALAYHARGDAAKAKAYLSKADAWMQQNQQGRYHYSAWGSPTGWSLWLNLRLLRREVEQTLAKK